MSKSVTDNFLEKYKSLELMLRVAYDDSMTVLTYESQLIGDDADKMRICRILRNFLQHNPNASGFVLPTQEMLDFLDGVILKVTAATEKAKDRLYRLPPLKNTSTLREACKAFTKGKGAYAWLPVVDSTGALMGILSEQRLVQAMSVAGDIDKVDLVSALRKTEWTKSLNSVSIVSVTDDLAPYVKNMVPVVVLRSGKYSGVIKW